MFTTNRRTERTRTAGHARTRAVGLKRVLTHEQNKCDGTVTVADQKARTVKHTTARCIVERFGAQRSYSDAQICSAATGAICLLIDQNEYCIPGRGPLASAWLS